MVGQEGWWTDLDAEIYDDIGRAATIAPKDERVAIIAPGDVEDFTIPAGDSGVGRASPSVPAYLAGDIGYLIETIVTIAARVPFAGAIAADRLIEAVGKILDGKSCITSMQSLIDHPVTNAATALNVFDQAFNIAAGCVNSLWEVAYGVSGAAWAFVMAVLAWIIDGVKQVSAGIGAAIETAAYYNDYTIAATVPERVPTLGLMWGSDQTGYGHPHPTEVYNGGDPTGDVTDLTWSSWGSPISIGSGTGWWVGPGKDVAHGEQEPVKMYAFKLGTCDGKYMYQAIEWVFTEYGQTFNSHSGYINICDGSYH